MLTINTMVAATTVGGGASSSLLRNSCGQPRALASEPYLDMIALAKSR